MNVLMVAPSLPYPPTSGGALRVYSLLRALHGAGHRVTLLALDDSGFDFSGTPLATLCARIETFPVPQRSKAERLKTMLTSGEADLARRLYSPELADRLRDLLHAERFDLVQCEALETACYLPIAKQAPPGPKLCLDTFNAEYHLQRVMAGIDAQTPGRWPMAAYSWLQAGRIHDYERAMCQLADIVIAVSPEDADLLRSFRADERVEVLPSAICVDDYENDLPAAKLDGKSIVFTGKMDYRPNVDAALWFVDDILPLVRQRVPNATFTIVGRQPAPQLDRLRDERGITLTGAVDSVVPYLRGAAAYVAPLRMGSGTRLKLLEAMAVGVPIVATPTAAAGLMPAALDAMKVVDGAQEVADALADLLTSPDTGRALVAAGKSAVRTYYDWSATAPALIALYKEHGLA